MARQDYNSGLVLIYEHAFFPTHWIIVLSINSPNVNNRHWGALQMQAPRSRCRSAHLGRARDGGGRKQTHATGRNCLIFVEFNVFLTLHRCDQKTDPETLEQKAEVVGPPSSRCNGPLKPPEGFIPAEGGTEQKFSPCRSPLALPVDLSLASAKTAAHQAEWLHISSLAIKPSELLT